MIKNKRKLFMKENRSTNFELLRLLCIIFIITHHTIVHGSFSLNCDKIEINQIFMLFSTTGGSIAVDIFVLLAGYFGIKNEFKIHHFIKLVFEVEIISLFWNVIIYIYCQEYGIFDIKNVFPIVFHRYSYIFEYLFIYACSNIINNFVYSLSKQKLKLIVVILLINYSIVPSIFSWLDYDNTNIAGFTMNIWFITMYIVGAYIRLYLNEISWEKGLIGLICSYCCLLTFIYTYNFHYVKENLMISFDTVFLKRNFIFTFSTSVLWLLTFSNLKISFNKTINYISSCSLTIFLFHDNVIARNVLWNHVFRQNKYEYTNELIPYLVLVVICVFAGGIVISAMSKKILTVLLSSKTLVNIERRISGWK